VILIGTKTSSWDALLAKDCEKTEQISDVWLQLVEECESKQGCGVTDESLSILSGILEDQYGIDFLLFAHEPTIENTTLKNVYPFYQDLAKEVAQGNSVLLDITHGFRSMPMFLYQSLRFSAITDIAPRSVSIVYGEFLPEKDVSIVRDLSNFWEFSEATESFELFKATFTTDRLAPMVATFWPEGAGWMRGFSNLVKSNYVLQTKQSIAQLNNALALVKPNNCPIWGEEVIGYCRSISNEFSKCRFISEYILVLSKLLEKNNLLTQTIIALQISVETRVIESRYDIKKIGDYNYWNENGGPKECKKDFQLNNNQRILFELEADRNKIAHGGGMDATTTPARENAVISKEKLAKYRAGVAALFKAFPVGVE
ncbi:TM1812 family CRISPR-associated protein, partial [Sphaerochaeta sp. S2]|uniref:TM1812 family CRISPR-associated protein n=1 Tax=Sphaerochaeta sp. S2 TaxID=2798868 RepID=UPI0018E916DA